MSGTAWAGVLSILRRVQKNYPNEQFAECHMRFENWVRSRKWNVLEESSWHFLGLVPHQLSGVPNVSFNCTKRMEQVGALE